MFKQNLKFKIHVSIFASKFGFQVVASTTEKRKPTNVSEPVKSLKQVTLNFAKLNRAIIKEYDTKKAEVVMTLTSPGCFAAGMIPGQVEQVVLEVPEVESVHVELTFDPPWDKTMMSEAARLELGFW